MGAADSPGQSFWNIVCDGARGWNPSVSDISRKFVRQRLEVRQRLTRIILKQQNHLGHEFVCLPFISFCLAQ